MEGTILTTVSNGYVLGVFDTPNKAIDYLNEKLDCGIRNYEERHQIIFDKQGSCQTPKPLSSSITLNYWAAEGGQYRAEHRLTEIPDKI